MDGVDDATSEMGNGIVVEVVGTGVAVTDDDDDADGNVVDEEFDDVAELPVCFRNVKSFGDDFEVVDFVSAVDRGIFVHKDEFRSPDCNTQYGRTLFLVCVRLDFI